MTNKIVKGSGNVFADIGLANPERIRARSEIMYLIQKIILDRKLKQQQVAEILNIPQSKVSCLMHGKLSMFSMDHLFEFLNALGRNVKIITECNAARNVHASTQVFLEGTYAAPRPRFLLTRVRAQSLFRSDLHSF